MYYSEVSLSSSLVTKFLANIGIEVKDIVVKVLPCEFGIENNNLERQPTVMLRVNHFTFEKQRSTIKRAHTDVKLEEMKDDISLTDSITSPSVASNIAEEPIPDILNILKKKVFKIGQISLHLLSSPFGTESHNNQQKWGELEFPYTFPPIRHLSTLLCIGNPENPSESSFEISLNQSEENERLFNIKSTIPSIESIIDPLQLCTLNAFLKTTSFICSKEAKIDTEEIQNPIESLSQSIIKDLTEENPQNSDIKSTIEEIRKGLDLDSLVSSTDSHGMFTSKHLISFDFEVDLKLVCISLIHDWSNSNRLYDRTFDGYFRIGKDQQCGFKQQQDVSIPGSHFLFELQELRVQGGYSQNISVNVSVKDLALYNYVLNEWKLPTEKEVKAGLKGICNLNQKLESTMTEKELKRKTEISKIQKTAIKRTTIRGQQKKQMPNLGASVGHIDDDESVYMSTYDKNEDNDDNESFKSFVDNRQSVTRSEMSSMIHESQFMDAIDDPDVWFMNKQSQHFSLIPLLTMKSFEDIKKSKPGYNDNKAMFSSMASQDDLKKSLMASTGVVATSPNFNFQLSHHLIDDNLLKGNNDSSSDSASEEERPLD